jgi:hypothetical protein
MKFYVLIFSLLFVVASPAHSKAKKVDDYHWNGVERVVAIGDLHGDYERYIEVMRSAGLIDKNDKWAGGTTHFVQTGDIPDRAPDTLKIIDHMVKLAKQAKRKGGYVHMLIGNHEAMNVIGDLRYVSEGEFKAFTTRNSARLQDMQWERQLEWMRANILTFEEIDLVTYRKEWEQKVPLGWVEHRQGWALSGKYGSLVKDNQVAIQINDTIFLHGGISAKYCRFSLQSLTEQVIEAMENFNPANETIVDDPLGPLWYRGLAQEEEDGVFNQTLDNILNRYGAKRIVIGHTPTGGVVWPRFDQRVVVNDTGIATYYGAHKGVLELTPDGATAIYGETRIPLPTGNSGRIDYLKAVIEADSNNTQLKQRLAKMLAPPAQEAGNISDENAAGQAPEGDTAFPEPIPDTCR